MKTVTQFNSTNLDQLREDISTALQAIKIKHGLSQLSLGSMSYDEGSFTARLTGKTDGGKRQDAARVGADQDLIGKQFKFRTLVYTVTNIKPRSRKYPIVAKNTNGTSWKFSLDVVNAGLI